MIKLHGLGLLVGTFMFRVHIASLVGESWKSRDDIGKWCGNFRDRRGFDCFFGLHLRKDYKYKLNE